MASRKPRGGEAEVDQKQKLGHGDNSRWPNVTKGTFLGVGSTVDLSENPFSPNQKTKTPSGTGSRAEP